MMERASGPVLRRILVVEDELLIAMELELMLVASGYEVIGPVTTIAAALALLDSERPDAGVLDMNLRGEKVTPVAAALKKMDIPFLLSSAYDQSIIDSEAALAGAPNMGKPASEQRLIETLAALLEAKTA